MKLWSVIFYITQIGVNWSLEKWSGSGSEFESLDFELI